MKSERSEVAEIISIQRYLINMFVYRIAKFLIVFYTQIINLKVFLLYLKVNCSKDTLWKLWTDLGVHHMESRYLFVMEGGGRWVRQQQQQTAVIKCTDAFFDFVF